MPKGAVKRKEDGKSPLEGILTRDARGDSVAKAAREEKEPMKDHLERVLIKNAIRDLGEIKNVIHKPGQAESADTFVKAADLLRDRLRKITGSFDANLAFVALGELQLAVKDYGKIDRAYLKELSANSPGETVRHAMLDFAGFAEHGMPAFQQHLMGIFGIEKQATELWRTKGREPFKLDEIGDAVRRAQERGRLL